MDPAFDAELWARLEAFSIDDAAAEFPFSARLAQENGWSRVQALAVVREYKRFLYLCVRAGHPCTPSDAVDQAWHLHLAYTRSYWEDLCERVLRRPLHHGPTRGGSEERAKYRDWYQATLRSYRQHFGEDPPAAIWPSPWLRFDPRARFRRVDGSRHWIVPRTAAMAGGGGILLLLGLATHPAQDTAARADLLGFILLVGLVVFVAVIGARKSTRRGSRKDDGCGGVAGCGTSGAADVPDSGDGGDSGCGSSGCGGGGCGGGD
jgi:hypothetical protein